MRFHYTPMRMTKIKQTWQYQVLANIQNNWWWEDKIVQPLLKTVWQFLIKLNIHLTTAYLPREIKTYVHTKTYSWTYKATSFIIAKKWKQTVHHRVYGERIHTYAIFIDYNNNKAKKKKKNELLVYATMWVNFKSSMLKEVRLRIPLSVRFDLYKILEKTKPIYSDRK